MNKNSKIDSYLDIKVHPWDAAIKFLAAGSFVIVSLWTGYYLDPEKGYRGGRLVLGDEGVFLVRLFLIGFCSLLVYWILVVFRNIARRTLVRVSGAGLKIGRVGSFIDVPWDDLSKIETSLWKRRNNKFEVHSMVLLTKSRGPVKASLYATGYFFGDLESAFTGFYKPASDLFE